MEVAAITFFAGIGSTVIVFREEFVDTYLVRYGGVGAPWGLISEGEAGGGE